MQRIKQSKRYTSYFINSLAHFWQYPLLLLIHGKNYLPIQKHHKRGTSLGNNRIMMNSVCLAPKCLSALEGSKEEGKELMKTRVPVVRWFKNGIQTLRKSVKSLKKNRRQSITAVAESVDIDKDSVRQSLHS